MKRSVAWVPGPIDVGPKKTLKFVKWDTGRERFHDNTGDKLQARVVVYLIDKLEVSRARLLCLCALPVY